MDTRTYSDILELLHREVKPALGCTEPIAVALAVAKACSLHRPLRPSQIRVQVSANILKNAMGVGIPGTGMVGLNIAVALAMECGNPDYGLEVLKDLTPADVEKAKAYASEGRVKISLANTPKKLYIDAECLYGPVETPEHRSKAIIQDDHDAIVFVSKDYEVLLDNMSSAAGEAAAASGQEAASHKTTLDYHLDMRKIFDFATKEARLEDIAFLLDAARMNRALAEEGLARPYGLQVGRTIQDNIHRNVFGKGLLTHCMAMTAAASDARMAGCTLPAMSNSGSGNQGITVTMPVVAAAEQFGSSEEQLIRALTLSHLTAIHIKGYLGKLSALCGCVVASTGSACGIVWLSGGSFEQVCSAIKNMIGNITGMVCDGAKVGCALKVASGVSSAVQSAVLALDNHCVTGNDGIIEDDVEKSIRNLGTIGSKGMQVTDEMILNIMVCK